MPWGGAQFAGHKCSLGYQVIDWIEAYCCHGPGDVQGDPIEMDDEWFSFIVNAYELNPVTGKRRVNRALLSRPKGRAKSELAGFIGVAEAFAPTRFDGWDANGQPVARPVRSPLLKCLATEESQAGNTFENIAFIASEWGPDTHPDIYRGVTGARRYQSATALYLPFGGEIRACTAGAVSKDGGKETWVCADESHLYILPETRGMYEFVARNLGKRAIAEPWLMQTTTMYKRGQLSTAEVIMQKWKKGTLENPERWLIDHREAKGRIDIRDKAHTIKQLTQVYGSAVKQGWISPELMYQSMTDPTECPDDATAARYFLNRSMSSEDMWIDVDIVERQMVDDVVEPGTAISIGFDGSLNDDSTVLFGCRMSDGLIFPIRIWEKPDGPEAAFWQVPRREVLQEIRDVHGMYIVSRGYYDPHEWRSDIDTVADEFGEDRVVAWETRRDVQTAAALDRLHVDLKTGVAKMVRDKIVLRHFGNAYVRMKGGHRLVRKEHPKSDRKIDSVPGAMLAYEARADALADGWSEEPPDRRVIVLR